ncbi:helix-turn-helix transcriptional regulator [Thermoactinomyces daqus]|uniref:Helix-turn-helix transcriptional regulator n=1 Tax=Thermoactinomyces daqus TaxID=1329516 RepID=A0A7W1XDK7_9BACL|nr:helix-turn-helix transcriptional regulator [Thermoactinomyces daqus]MBA4544597.1 helix-turn-helix transcriptional regulator [Thermoactinomyces daqus]
MDEKLVEEAKTKRLYNHKAPIVKTDNRLGEIIKELGITQMDAALKTGIPQATLSKWNKQERFNPDFIASIMVAFDLDFFDLFPIVEKHERPAYFDEIEAEIKEKPGEE